MDNRGFPSQHQQYPPQLTISHNGQNAAPDMAYYDDYSPADPAARSLMPPPRNPYSASVTPDSLLSPATAQDHKAYFDQSVPPSPAFSEDVSRRSSWSSASHRESTRSEQNPFASAYDSRAPSPTGSVDNLTTQTVAQLYSITPASDLIVFPDESEKDDYMHNPGPDDNKRDCNIWSARGMSNVLAMLLIFGSMLVLMIGWPIL